MWVDVLNLALVRERVWLRTELRSMGSTAEILIDGDPPLMAQATRRLHELEACWSRFDVTSELERLHAARGGWRHISSDLALALRWCQRMSAETDGLFDPTVRAALQRWGYDCTFREIDASDRTSPPQHDRGSCTAPARTLGFELSCDGGRARIEPGSSIDLGGLGKGLAADLISADLLSAGANAVYVCLGGDIHAAGEPPEGGWQVPMLDPRTGVPFAHHTLHDGALVMSTTVLRRWNCGGIEAHHLIDPRTGAPSRTGVVAVAVAGRSAARSEALAKSALIAGEELGARLLTAAGVTAWILTDEAVIVVRGDGALG